MAVTKEQALEHIAEVYEYASSLSSGPNHPLARELATWMQRHWAQAGVNAANTKRREKNVLSKQAVAQPAESTLQKFVHPKSPAAKLGETATPKPAAQVSPKPQKPLQGSPPPPIRPLPVKEPPKSLNPVAADDTPLSDSDLKTIAVMRTRAILETFGEARITAALKAMGITEDEMPDSGAQKAAMLKQRKK